MGCHPEALRASIWDDQGVGTNGVLRVTARTCQRHGIVVQAVVDQHHPVCVAAVLRGGQQSPSNQIPFTIK